jgi:MFS transporter, ACS family, tartrate transporter
VLYSGLLTGITGLVIWLPQVVKGFGFSNLAVGFVVAIPYIVTVPVMVAWGRHSDKTGERVWHVAIPAFLGALGLIASASSSIFVIQLLGVTIGIAGLYSAMPAFWALPATFLSGAAAAGGFAWITAIANLGGFFGPSFIGYVKELTGSYAFGIAAMAAGGFLASFLAIALTRGQFGRDLDAGLTVRR